MTEFLGRFALDAALLYLADAAKKFGTEGLGRKIYRPDRLQALGVPPFLQGQKLVDIIAYSPRHNWLFLIEAVHSVEPVDAATTHVAATVFGECHGWPGLRDGVPWEAGFQEMGSRNFPGNRGLDC